MSRIPIFNVGSVGVVRDLPDHLLPPEAWTDAKNFRFQDNKAVKFSGEQAVFDPPTVTPYFAMGAVAAADYHIIYPSLTKIYSVNSSGTHTDRTRAVGGDYTGGATDLWNGDILGGIPVLTNNVDVPQFWADVGTGAFADLTNWPASTACRLMRAFKQFLVGLYITSSGTVYPHRVKWSHPAVPGSVPSSWDETDATVDAGEYDLSDSQAGSIVEARLLGDLLIIYKEAAMWSMQYVGGRAIMGFRRIPGDIGALSQRCVGVLPKNGLHFVATGDDVVIHDGRTAQTLLDKREKRWLRTNLESDAITTCYVVANTIAGEMWFCFPETGATAPTLALVWSQIDNTIGFRELTSNVFIGQMVVSDAPVGLTWDSDSMAWDTDSEVWGQQNVLLGSPSLVQCDPTNTQLLQLDVTNQLQGADMSCYLERTGIALIGRDRMGNPKTDPGQRKICNRIWVKGSGGPFDVKVGAQEQIGGTVTWEAAQSFDPSVDEYLDVSVAGRLLAIRFESSSNIAWSLDAYDLDIQLLGEV